MRLVTEKGRISVTRSKEENICYSCHDRTTAKNSKIFELEGKKYVILCDFCINAVEQLEIGDEEVYGFVGGLRIKKFLSQIGEVDGRDKRRSGRTSIE